MNLSSKDGLFTDRDCCSDKEVAHEAVLRESFQVQHSDTGDFVLTPIRDNVGFKQLTLHMQEAAITGMDIRDNLDQRVVIVFSDLDSKTVLSTADFGFSPPEGVDLFYYDK